MTHIYSPTNTCKATSLRPVDSRDALLKRRHELREWERPYTAADTRESAQGTAAASLILLALLTGLFLILDLNTFRRNLRDALNNMRIRA